jgi:hypothetical protein
VRHRQTLYVAPRQTLNIPFQVTNDASENEKGLFYPGLVNISGTYCFMNSTMQVRCLPLVRSSGNLIILLRMRHRHSPLSLTYNHT